jgi:hypothetical protein
LAGCNQFDNQTAAETVTETADAGAFYPNKSLQEAYAQFITDNINAGSDLKPMLPAESESYTRTYEGFTAGEEEQVEIKYSVYENGCKIEKNYPNGIVIIDFESSSNGTTVYTAYYD